MATFTCPEGHQSADPEWCDTCGSPIGAAPAAAVPPPSAGSPPAAPPSPVVAGSLVCTHCGTANEVDALFCESCGFDFTTGQAPPPPPTPVAVPTTTEDTPTDFAVDVAVDSAWYALQGAQSDEPCPPPSSVRLGVHGTTVLIGRTSTERSIAPEVALNDDPGVSRRHAQLVQAPDGTWSAVDLESMNGTYVVGPGEAPDSSTTAIPAGEPVPLPIGSRVFVGAWSSITLIDRRDPPPPPTTEPS